MGNLILGDCLVALRDYADNYFDAVITDPPYGLAFMNKKWDYDVPSVAIWREVLRVLKPGGHLLSFGGTRTYHRMVVNIEDAGFEIRDQIQWLYGSGFPKSLDISKAIDKQAGAEREVVGVNPSSRPNSKRVSGKEPGGNPDGELAGIQPITAPSTLEAKQWEGWGTALKPANEPIVLARKPLERGLTVADNVLKWGTGGLNIDACRIGTEKLEYRTTSYRDASTGEFSGQSQENYTTGTKAVEGRFPANLILDEVAAEMLDAQTGELKGPWGKESVGKTDNAIFGNAKSSSIGKNYSGQTGGASRFFYVAKASKSERNKGLDGCEIIYVTSEAWENGDLKATLLVDTEQSPPKVIDASGTFQKSVSEWSTLLFGKNILVQSPEDCRSITKTKTSLITESIILNWLRRFNTSVSIPDVNLSTANGGSPVEAASHLSQSSSIINDETVTLTSVSDAQLPGPLRIKSGGKFKSTHPTVKPVKLMEYLIKLVTPPNGIVLDPFMGSGSTGVACKNLGIKFTGIERETTFLEIAKCRMELSKASIQASIE